MVHSHIPNIKRKKLDDDSIHGVLIGVSEESKGYKIYDLVNKKVIISRDVVFEEDKKWCWDNSYEKQVSADLDWEEVENSEEKDKRNDDPEHDMPNPINHAPTPTTRERRKRIPFAWLKVYETGDKSDEVIN